MFPALMLVTLPPSALRPVTETVPVVVLTLIRSVPSDFSTLNASAPSALLRKLGLPVKVWLPLSRATFELSRASASVPVAMFEAFRLVSREPFKAGRKPDPFSCTSWLAPLKVLPCRVTLPLRRASGTVPVARFEAFRFVRPAPLAVMPVAVMFPPLSTLNWLVPFFCRLMKSAAEPAPVFGAFKPMYVPPFVAVLPPAMALPTRIRLWVAELVGAPVRASAWSAALPVIRPLKLGLLTMVIGSHAPALPVIVLPPPVRLPVPLGQVMSESDPFPVPAPIVARTVAASASSRTVRTNGVSVVVAAVPLPVK